MKSQHNTLSSLLKPALLAASLLLLGQVSVAQDSTIPATGEKNVMRIRVQREENGKVISIDTTFNAASPAEVQELLKARGLDLPELRQHPLEPPRIVEFRKGELSPERMAEIEKRVEEFRQNIKVETRELPDGREVRVLQQKDGEPKSFVIRHFDKVHGEGADLEKADLEMLLQERGIKMEDGVLQLPEGANGEKVRVFSLKNGELKSTESCNFTVVSPKECQVRCLVVCTRATVAEPDKAELEQLRKVTEDKTVASRKALPVEDFALYPNPSQGLVNVSFNLDKRADTALRIYDVAGREVYKEELKNFEGSYSKEINLAGNPSGTYFLHVTQGKGGFTRKIVLQ